MDKAVTETKPVVDGWGGPETDMGLWIDRLGVTRIRRGGLVDRVQIQQYRIEYTLDDASQTVIRTIGDIRWVTDWRATFARLFG